MEKTKVMTGLWRLALLVIVIITMTMAEAPASADAPTTSPSPLGYGDCPSEMPTDPVFVPFAEEYIITASEGDTSYYVPSQEDGTFGARSTVISGISDGAAIADFDNDGDLDFVIGAGSRNIVLYRNDGGGLYDPVTVVSDGPLQYHTQMRAADFNKDGKLDFTSGSMYYYGGSQRVYLNQGGLVFLPVDIDSSWIDSAVYGREVGDFNEDGNQDIAILGLYGPVTGKVRIYYGNGDGTFNPPVQVIDLVSVRPGTDGTSSLASGDFNSDGKLDLLVGCSYSGSSTGRVYLFVGDGMGAFTFIPGPEADGATLDLNDGVTNGQGGTYAYDFDKDGKLDVVSVNWNGRKLFFHRGNGDGTFQPRVLVDTGHYAAGVAGPPLEWSAVGIDITSPQEGQTFWIEAEPEPRMPTINCKAKVIGIDPDPTATTEFSWEAVVTYTDHGRNDVHRFESGKVTGGAWIPDFKNVIAGGNLTIKVKAVIDGKEYQDSVTGYIRGRNPNKGTVKDTLGELILQVICYKESSPKWYQFDSSGLPVFGPPGGFGLMQLDTPPPTSQQIWSWLENAKGGRTMWREKVAMSKNYVKRVKKANADQKVTNLSHEQHERQAAYLYRGAAWVDGEWQYYYAWNRDAKQWEVNPKADATSKVYADDAMNIKAAVLAGNPPPGW